MTGSILGTTPRTYKKMLTKRILLCAALGILTIALNALCIFLRTDQNHSIMLWCNILTDILFGFFAISYIYGRIVPQKRLYSLFSRHKTSLSGTVCAISEVSTRYMGITCLKVSVHNRTLFLPVDTLQLEENTAYTFTITSNIILEVAQ